MPDMSTLAWRVGCRNRPRAVMDVRVEQVGACTCRARAFVLRQQVNAARDLGLHDDRARPSWNTTSFRSGYRQAAEREYRGLQPWDGTGGLQLLQGNANGGFYYAAARRHLNERCAGGELQGRVGLGQHELNVRYAETLQMADRHVCVQTCSKELPNRQALRNVLAKFAQDRAGSSCQPPSQPLA